MSAAPEKFTLRPQEKRLLAFIGVVLFVAFNIWFVWPTFKDWASVQKQISDFHDKIRLYQNEKNRLPEYQEKLREIRGGDDAPEIAKVDQKVEFRRKVESLALSENISVQNLSGPNLSGNVATNQFFEEWNLSLTMISGEKDLVSFLYKLSSGASTIRVRDMNLSQGPNFTNLSAGVVLVANYQKTNSTTVAKKP